MSLLTSIDRIKVSLALWAAGLCAVSGCPSADISPRDPQARARDPCGAFTAWQPYRSAWGILFRVSGNGQWLSAAEPKRRLRVWRLGDDGSIDSLQLDSVARRFTLQQFAWCGDQLLCVRWTGLIDVEALDRVPPPNGIEQYLADRFQSVTWNPATDQEGPGVPDGFYVAMADQQGRRLVVFDAPPQREGAPEPSENPGRIFRMPGFELRSDLTVPLGGVVRPYVGSLPWLLGWHSEEDGFFCVARQLAPARPGHAMAFPVSLLVFVSDTGVVRQVSQPKEPRLVGTRAGEVPAVALVAGGTGAAALIRHWGGKTGIGVYDEKGLEREYLFSVRRPFPPKLAKIGPWWRFIVCTPDGQHALFQETRDPNDPDDSRRGPWWVYLWDLEQETQQPITQMNEITNCFGWLSETAVIVGARAETIPPDTAMRQLYDYGVLQLVKPEVEAEREAD